MLSPFLRVSIYHADESPTCDGMVLSISGVNGVCHGTICPISVNRPHICLSSYLISMTSTNVTGPYKIMQCVGNVLHNKQVDMLRLSTVELLSIMRCYAKNHRRLMIFKSNS